MATIQWFPGHMAKALRQIREQMPLVDIVFELVDARVPYSSQNPEVDLAAGDKPRLLILTKTDLADPKSPKNGCSTLKIMDSRYWHWTRAPAALPRSLPMRLSRF